MTIPFNSISISNNRTKPLSKVDKAILIGLSSLIMFGPIRDFINVISLIMFGSYFESFSTMLQVVTILLFAYSLLYVLLKKHWFVSISFVIFAMLWMLSYHFNKEAQPFITNGINLFFFESLPFLWVFYYIFSQKDEFKLDGTFNAFLKVNSIKLLIVVISQSLMFLLPKCDIYHDYMSASYTLLNPLILVIAFLLCGGGGLMNIINVVLASLYILLLGCRGALVCEIVFLSGYFVLFAKKNKSFYRLSFISLVFLMLLLIQPIADLLVLLGLNSRAVESIRNYEFFKDENRSIIFEIISLKTLQNPFGLGVMADRPILLSSSQLWQIFYSHNLFLELGIDFGFLGYFLFAVFLFIIVVALKKGSYNTKIIIWSFFCMSVIKLMFSSTLWADQYLWALLGSVCAIISKKGGNMHA